MGLARRLSWYRTRFQVNNPVVGRAIELFGNRVRMDGFIYSVNCSQISTSHKSTLAFGLHEMDERALIKKWLPRELPVLEFGGGLGVVSCLINRKLSKPERHVVVEANPEMIAVLERNRQINGCKFQIHFGAICYDMEHVNLNIDQSFVGSSIRGDLGRSSIRVKATDVSSLLDSAGFDEAGIVCDIEGIEADIIRRELPVLGDRIRFFMAEMHPKILGDRVVTNLLVDLRDLGFVLKERIGDNVFYARTSCP